MDLVRVTGRLEIEKLRGMIIDNAIAMDHKRKTRLGGALFVLNPFGSHVCRLIILQEISVEYVLMGPVMS